MSFEKHYGYKNGVLAEIVYTSPENTSWEFSLLTGAAVKAGIKPIRDGGPGLNYEYKAAFSHLRAMMDDANAEQKLYGCIIGYVPDP